MKVKCSVVFVGSVQDESNGRLSISENHSAKVDALKKRNSSATVQELEKNHTTYDFSDEQVQITILEIIDL